MHASISQLHPYKLLFLLFEHRFQWLAFVKVKVFIINPEHVVKVIVNVDSMRDLESSWRGLFICEDWLLHD